jgi:WD40 repeat protein
MLYVFSNLAWHPNGKLLAVAGEDEKIEIWDVDAKQVLSILRGNAANESRAKRNAVITVAWSPDGKRFVSASPDGTFLLWDTSRWQVVFTLRPTASGVSLGHASHAGTLAWSSDPDGRQLAFFGNGGDVTIWDATPADDKMRKN